MWDFRNWSGFPQIRFIVTMTSKHLSLMMMGPATLFLACCPKKNTKHTLGCCVGGICFPLGLGEAILFVRFANVAEHRVDKKKIDKVSFSSIGTEDSRRSCHWMKWTRTLPGIRYSIGTCAAAQILKILNGPMFSPKLKYKTDNLLPLDTFLAHANGNGTADCIISL